MPAALRDSSRALSGMLYSASTHGSDPKLSVSTTSTPTSKNERCRSSMTSGLVSTRTSLQPSIDMPPKSSAVSSRSWRLVPVAPSKTTTRSRTASRYEDMDTRVQAAQPHSGGEFRPQGGKIHRQNHLHRL